MEGGGCREWQDAKRWTKTNGVRHCCRAPLVVEGPASFDIDENNRIVGSVTGRRRSLTARRGASIGRPRRYCARYAETDIRRAMAAPGLRQAVERADRVRLRVADQPDGAAVHGDPGARRFAAAGR